MIRQHLSLTVPLIGDYDNLAFLKSFRTCEMGDALVDDWKALYFPALADFVRNGGEPSRSDTYALKRSLHETSNDEILRHHEESVQFLLSYAEPEDRMTFVHRSLLFVTELLIALRMPVHPPSNAEKMWQSTIGTVPPVEGSPNTFESVLQHLDSGVALFDNAGNLRFVNVQMARMLRVPRRSLIGCTLPQLFRNPHLKLSIRKSFLRLYKEMAYCRNFHGEFIDANGRFLLMSISQIGDFGGDYLINVKDVSEYKQIEQAVFQNDKLAMLGKIAAAIAHEIRNPLTAIRGFIQLLTPYLEDIGKQEYGRVILSEIDRANEIIYEFLNSSKPTAPMKKIMNVGLLLKETILLLESEAHMKGYELHCEVYDPILTVSIDVKQVKQVLLNMMKNAMDAIGEVRDARKGRIDVTARREGQKAVISIRDNGNGMDETTLSKLFDPFYTTKEAGTGLGLSVSYRIIVNHGGTIRAESRLNEGTEFTIYLPFTEGKE
jgi:signal transduction histidine kinase